MCDMGTQGISCQYMVALYSLDTFDKQIWKLLLLMVPFWWLIDKISVAVETHLVS